MQSSREIKRRLQTVHDTGKIAKAMKAVSVSKLKKAQRAMEHAARYAEEHVRALSVTSRALSSKDSPFVGQVDLHDASICLVVVSSDRGLCGAYNQRVLDAADRFLQSYDITEVCAVGRRAISRLHRRGYDDLSFEAMLAGQPDWETSKHLGQYLVNTVRRQRASAVVFLQNTFVNAMHYGTEERILLPLHLEEGNGSQEADTEPGAQDVFGAILSRTVCARVHHWLCEAMASEHAARMVAMSDAYDNCQELGHNLTRELNKLRQTNITKELLEIVSGAEALTGHEE